MQNQWLESNLPAARVTKQCQPNYISALIHSLDFRLEPRPRPRPRPRTTANITHTMNAILNAVFILARAQLVDQRPEASATDPIEEAGLQLTTFRTHSAPDPIAEPLYEPPFVRPYSESEKGMMYGSASDLVRGHCRGTSSVRFNRLSQVRARLRFEVTGLDNNRQDYFNVHRISPIIESSSP